jgi:hypothetical protein
MTIKSRLKRLEAARPEPLGEVVITWPDQYPDAPPLAPGWHPELNLTVIKWPDDPYEKLESAPATA